MTEWTRRTHQQAYHFRNVPQLTAFEYAVTTCCETVAEAINHRLDEKGLPPIPLLDTLDDRDPKTNKVIRAGIYTAVQSIAAREVLAFGKVEGKPLINAAGNVLKQAARHSLSDLEILFNHFIETHPQMKHVPELATPQAFGSYVASIVQEEINNWLQNKPSRPNSYPPSGRAI